MIIKRKSPLSGNWNEMDLPVTLEQLRAWEGGMLIQNAMPNLSAVAREFIITGLTASEWDDLMGEEK